MSEKQSKWRRYAERILAGRGWVRDVADKQRRWVRMASGTLREPEDPEFPYIRGMAIIAQGEIKDRRVRGTIEALAREKERAMLADLERVAVDVRMLA